ncbi:MAG TPA: DNA topoisomerase IB [Casimicrobiaceae bacterium]|nr:DNA topoisomerase IB [Casimicrobiaceae bacterium]
MEDTRANKVESVTDVMAEAAEMAVAAGLVYVSDSDPGIRRLRQGKDFAYVRPDDRPLVAAADLARIASLAIPPAYEDVWICTDRRGHLQATGRDARRRKQYRYHPKWRLLRDGAKFERMVEFGEALPRLRLRLRRDLALPGLPREKVLAVIVSLLDATWVRIGNAEYARDNNSYGLTTLKNRHVQFIRDGRLLFRFRGKGGADHEIAVDDKRLVKLVRRCHQLPGQRLFQYVDEDGGHHPIDSDQVNAYLRDVMGADFTAKDFRTWGATLRAIALMTATPLPEAPSERALNECIVAVVKKVAAELRNTPAVCRKSYINPVVFVAWRSGSLHKAIRDDITAAPRKAERLALSFLRRQSRADKRGPTRTNPGPGPARVP